MTMIDELEFEPDESESQDQVEAVAEQQSADLLARLHDGPTVEEPSPFPVPDTVEATTPEYETPELEAEAPSGEPQELRELLDRPPSAYERMGEDLDEVSARGIVAQVRQEMEAEGFDTSVLDTLNVEQLAETMEANGLQGRDGLRGVVNEIAARDAYSQKEQRAEARFQAMEERLAETRAASPGGPLEAMAQKLNRLEEMLTEGREHAEIKARIDAEEGARFDAHAGALDLLAAAMKTRGEIPPTGPQVQQWYEENHAINLPAAVAARMCFEAHGVQVAPRQTDRNRQSVVTSSRIVSGRVSTPIPSGSTGNGSGPELRDLLTRF